MNHLSESVQGRTYCFTVSENSGTAGGTGANMVFTGEGNLKVSRIYEVNTLVPTQNAGERQPREPRSEKSKTSQEEL